MSNEYLVTISLPNEEHLHYKAIVNNVYKDVRTKKIVVTKQKGKNNHLHFHLIIATEEHRTQNFRQQFRTHFRPLVINKINLNIKKIDVLGKVWNYLKRDPSTKIVASRGYDLDRIRAEAIANPDYKKKTLPWAMLVPKLRSIGYKYPERPGKYLKQLSETYDVYPIITNCKKLSSILRFEGSKDATDWEDVFITTDNRQILL